MANEQIFQQGIKVVRRDNDESIIITPTGDNTTDISKISFEAGFGGQSSELVFDHVANEFTLEVDGIVKLLATSSTITIGGDVIVSGTTTTTNSQDLVVADNVITLNDGETLAGVGGGVGTSGIVIDRGTLTDVSWLFDEINDWWGPDSVITKIGNISAIDATDATEQVLTIVSSGAIIPPSGTSGEQPATPIEGMFRYNESIDALEVRDSVGWAKVLSTGGITPVTVAGNISLGNTYSLLSPIDPTTDNEVGDRGYNDARYLNATENLADLTDVAVARANLGLNASALDAVARGGDNMYGPLVMGDGGTINVTYDSIAAAGTGYAVDDIVTISGGTFTTALQLKVTSVGGGGEITGASTDTKGVYTVAPGSPASTTTSGSGVGATVNLTTSTPELYIVPYEDYTTAAIVVDIGKTNGVDGWTGADLRFGRIHAEYFQGIATEALYADLAERYEADKEYEPGTVVIFGGEAEVTTTSVYADTRVAGVVSTNPAFKMNSGAGFSETHPYIALKGKVPCKITGPAKKGDLIMTSKLPGYGTAVKYGPIKPYTAFARANEDFDGSIGVINVSII